MSSIVSIDLETTGLDENREAIIEIGAVKFNGRRVEDEFSTLLNPGRAIPPCMSRKWRDGMAFGKYVWT